MHPEDREYVIEAIKKGFNGDLQSIDYWIILPNGKERSVHTQSEIFFDAENIPVRAEGIIQDVTERKRAEEAIRLSNLYNRSLIEASLDALVTIGRNGKITDVNSATEQVTGYSRNDLIGTDFSDYFTEPEKAREGYQQVFMQGEVRDYPLEIQHKDGHITPVLYNASVYRNENDEVIGVFAAARDITERKKIETSLQESEGRFRSVLENSLDSAYRLDFQNNHFDYMSPVIEQITGFTPEEIDSMGNEGLFNRIHPEDQSRIDMAIKQSLVEGVGTHEYRFKCKDGKSRWLADYFSLIRDKRGLIRFRAGIVRDITKRKQEESRMSRYNLILEGINWIFSNVLRAKTEEELGNTCLSVALEVTGSEFGFINEIGEDGLLYDVAKSKLGWEQCLMYDKTGHPSSQSSFVVQGLYGSVIKNEKSFYTNNPQAHPDSIGLPNGHPPLRSFLGVPLVQDGETVGLIAVANREGGYSCEQQEDLEAIASAVIQALQRKRSEETIRLSNLYNRSLIEASLDPLVTIGRNGKITDVNYATEQVTGYSRSELIGTDFSDYFTEPEKAREGYQQVFLQWRSQGLSP